MDATDKFAVEKCRDSYVRPGKNEYYKQEIGDIIGRSVCTVQNMRRDGRLEMHRNSNGWWYLTWPELVSLIDRSFPM